MHRLSDDHGAIAVTFAIILAVLVGMSALAVDGGYWYASQQQLQTAADAAALAGCQQLALKSSNAEIWDVVENYAARNFKVPLGSAACSVVQPSPGGMSDITDTYVKVTVQSQSPSFLSRIVHGSASTTIRAQAVARVGYLAGADSPVPWGLNIIRVGSMSAVLGGYENELWDQGDGVWSGGFPSGVAGGLTVNATNSSGYIATFDGLIRVGVLPEGGTIREVSLSRTTFTSGIDTTCRFEVSIDASLAAGDKVTASVGRSTADLQLDTSTDRYVGVLGVPTTDDPYLVTPVSVTVTKDKVAEQVQGAVLVRRANFVLQDVQVDPLFISAGDSVSVAVTVLEFRQGRSYELKVEGGAGSAGNFQALDFGSLDHSLCGEDGPEAGYTGGSSYRDWIVGTEGLLVHLEDLVSTLPGDKVGPTNSGIGERLAGSPFYTLAEWEAAGRPRTKQLLTVPICEQVEDINGRTTFQIVSFGTFFLEQVPTGSQDTVRGVFIEYTAPGMVVVDEPPYGIVVEAVHLDPRELDF